MSTRLTCPQCKDQLVLKRPAISGTKVKCRSCGAKFYAGKSAQVIQAPTPHESTDAITAGAAPILTATVATMATAERKKVKIAKPWRRPKWLVPAGVAALVGVAILSIFFSQKPPPVPAPTGALADATSRASKPKVVNEGIKELVRAHRPNELIGIWEFVDGPGRIKLEKDGKVKVQGSFTEGLPLDFESYWGLEVNGGIDGTQYNLEFGPGPSLAINHHISVRLQEDGRLKLLKYVTPMGARYEPRLMKKLEEQPSAPPDSAKTAPPK